MPLCSLLHFPTVFPLELVGLLYDLRRSPFYKAFFLFFDCFARPIEPHTLRRIIAFYCNVRLV